MSTTSGDFVNSVRESINKKKEEDYRRRTILRESLETLLDIFKKSGSIEIRNSKDFETNEMSYSLNLYLDSENIHGEFKVLLEQRGISLLENKIDSRNIVYLTNFGKTILSNSSSDTLCFIELRMTGKYFFSLKIFLKTDQLSYRIYDSSYFYQKLWVFDGVDFSNHEVQILTSDRSKKKLKANLAERYYLSISFDELGEITETNISKKRGAKSNF